jgi:hypothetical protein
MRRHFLTSRALLPVMTALVSLTVVCVAGQTPATQGRASVSSRTSTSSKRGTVPRTPDGHPDLQGIWNGATLTRLERPAAFAGKAAVTEAEATAFVKESLRVASEQRKLGLAQGDTIIAYNEFWLDSGTMLTRIDNEYRTSIIIDPPDGKMPPLTTEAKERLSKERAFRAGPTGADDPEIRPLSERCILGVGSPAGPPTLSGAYNNLKQIVQTKDYVSILVEMNHDARVIPFNRPHLPKDIRQWTGDSVARWEGDTMVIDTTNFIDKVEHPARGAETSQRFGGSSDDLRVVERLTRVDADTIVYRFTIDDPKTYTRPWTGEYAWVRTDERLLEYACHEGNYAFGGILRGARMHEKETAERAQVK